MPVSTAGLAASGRCLAKAAKLFYFCRMQADLPLKKIFKIALVTSPFLGLFGSTPGLAMRSFAMGRSIEVFLVITLFTFSFWLINIFLIWARGYFFPLRYNAVRFITSAVICSLVVFAVFQFIKPSMPGEEIIQHRLQHHSHPHLLWMPITQALSINIIIFILLELIILRETKNKVASENEQLKLANLEARNTQLKQQLHPHFLFNSLTTLSSLINRSPEQAQDYLEKLADLLRFSTNNSQQALVPLQQEVELCTNYLNMQKVRFGAALNFNINIPAKLQQNGRVPIYSLQQLAENAIKHNALTKEHPLQIEINNVMDKSWIEIKNNLQPKQVMGKNNGVGLANLSERYRLLSDNDIIIKQENDYFSVAIKVFSNAGSNN